MEMHQGSPSGYEFKGSRAEAQDGDDGGKAKWNGSARSKDITPAERGDVVSARSALEQAVEDVPRIDLGSVSTNTRIQAAIPPVQVLTSYQTTYPSVVIEALGDLYLEYNRSFKSLAAANREWQEDYRFNVDNCGGTVNHFVQIDMLGLPESFLRVASSYSRAELRETLRGRIFEIENSIAAYHLLSTVFSSEAEPTTGFGRSFRESLEEIRLRYQRPIALLAVTQNKYESMLGFEFGMPPGAIPDPARVRTMSGFDAFFGPQQFVEYLRDNGGRCEALLFVRSSDPIEKLKNPRMTVEGSILADPELRRIIKAHALTLNVDAPDMIPARRINDTKEYLPTIGMGYRVDTMSSVLHPDLVEHLNAKRPWGEYQGVRLAPSFGAYLRSAGVGEEQIESGAAVIRAKPLKGTYGCYGHVRGSLSDREVRGDLRKNLETRGAYVIQPELSLPLIQNTVDGATLTYIDRNFFAMTQEGPRFLGGFRSMMNVDSKEAKNGRLHGSADTLWAEIVSEQKNSSALKRL